MAAGADLGEEGIVVTDIRAGALEEFEDGERGRFTQVVHVAFVGDAQH